MSGLASHVAKIGAGTIVGALASFIATPVITRLVDPTQFGQYSMFTFYGSIALMVLGAGQDQSLMRFWPTSNSETFHNRLFHFCMRVSLAFFAAAVLACSILKLSGIFDEFSWAILALLYVFVFLQILVRMNGIVLRVQMRSGLFSVLNVLYKVLYLVLAVAGLMLINDGDQFMLLCLATTFAYGISALIGILSLKAIWKPCIAAKESVAFDASAVLRYGLPFVVAMGLSTFFEGIDKLCLSQLTDYYNVGIYSSALSIVSAFSIIQSTFNTIWAPEVVKRYEADKNDHSFYIKGHNLIVVIMFGLGICLIAFRDVVVLFLGESYRDAAALLPCLTFIPLMATVSETTVIGINLMKKSTLHIVTSSVAVALNLIGNYLLIPVLGCAGAALSTSFSYIAFLAIKSWLSYRCYRVNFGFKRLCALTVALYAYAISQSFLQSGLINVLGAAACFSLLLVLYRATVLNALSLLREKMGLARAN